MQRLDKYTACCSRPLPFEYMHTSTYPTVSSAAITVLEPLYMWIPLNDHGFRAEFENHDHLMWSLVLIEAAPRQVHSMFSSILPLLFEYIHTSIYPTISSLWTPLSLCTPYTSFPIT